MAIFVYPMSTLFYRQHAQHTVNIDTMHTMHKDHVLSSNECIHNNINKLNVIMCAGTPENGVQGVGARLRRVTQPSNKEAYGNVSPTVPLLEHVSLMGSQ